MKMETWIVYAIASMVFAGFTSVLAKYGLQNVHADLGLGVRTATIFVLVTTFVLVTGKVNEITHLSTRETILLICSGITTTFSWIFYYRAMKEGLVSYVAAIDKASILITLILSFVLLKEPVTAKILIGSSLIFIGMLVLVWK